MANKENDQCEILTKKSRKRPSQIPAHEANFLKSKLEEIGPFYIEVDNDANDVLDSKSTDGLKKKIDDSASHAVLREISNANKDPRSLSEDVQEIQISSKNSRVTSKGSSNGYIDACTEGVSRNLHLNLNEHKTHISEISPDLARVNGIFTLFYINKQKEKFVEKRKEENGKQIANEEVGEFESPASASVSKADGTFLYEKFDKSLSHLLELQPESVFRMGLHEISGLQTTFRAATKENTLGLLSKRLSSIDPQQSKGIYDKYLVEGETVEIIDFSNRNVIYSSHCQIHEEFYGESVYRILRLSPLSRKVRDDEASCRELGFKNSRRLFSTIDKQISYIPGQRSQQNEDMEELEDSFLRYIEIPNERDEYMNQEKDRDRDRDRSTNSLENAKNFNGDNINSVTSRKIQTGISNYDIYEKTSLYDASPLDRSRDLLINGFLNSTVRKSRTASPGQSIVLHPVPDKDRRKSVSNAKEQQSQETKLLFKRNTQTDDLQTSTSRKGLEKNTLMNPDPIKKFFQKHNGQIKRDLQENRSTTGSTTSSTNRIHNAVEKAFGTWQKANQYHGWLLFSLLTCIAAFIILISYFVLIEVELQEILLDSNSLFYIGTRISCFLGLGRDAIILDLYLDGYVTADRHKKYGINNYIDYILDEATANVKTLDAHNNILRSYVDGLSGHLQNDLFTDMIPIQFINETNNALNILQLNTFEAVTKIVLFGVEIVGTSSNDISSKKVQIVSLISNSFNTLLEKLDNPYGIYSSKIDEDFDLLDYYFIACILAVAVSAVIIFSYTGAQLKSLLRDTNKFWEALLRFEMRTADNHVSELKAMLDGLKKDLSSNELFMSLNKAKQNEVTYAHPKSKSKNPSAKESFGFIKKYHNWTSLKTYLPTLIPLILIYILFIFSLSISRVLIGVQSNTNADYISNLKNIFQTYKLQALTTISLYQYISTNNSVSILNQPVGTILPNELDHIFNVFDFITVFESQNDDAINNLIHGDLCSSIFSNLNASLCRAIGEGANTHGITGMMAFLAEKQSFIKTYFDQNQQDDEVQMIALNLDSLKEIEMEFAFMDLAFQAMANSLQDKDAHDQLNFDKGFFIILVIVVLIECVVWLLLVYKAYWNLRAHKENQALVLKNIPISLIFESKLIRNYVFSLFKGSILSVKTGD